MNPGLGKQKMDIDALIAQLRAIPAIERVWRSRAYQKGGVVIRQGDSIPDIFILERGLIKLHYTTFDGKEWIKSFIADRGLFGSRSAQSGLTSTFTANCIEPSRIVRLPYALFLDAVSANPALNLAFLAFSEWVGLKKERREYDLLCLSAEQRCRQFLDHDAALAARLSQGDVARYLGITPIAFSRIKKMMSSSGSEK